MSNMIFPQNFHNDAGAAEMLKLLPGWERVDSDQSPGLKKTYMFIDFKACISFMSAVVDDIEELQHHPQWINTYSRLEVFLTTWDEANTISLLDYKLAYLLDQHFLDFS